VDRKSLEMVVWKLASLKDAQHIGWAVLDMLAGWIDQLKARFEKEIKGGKRPALRRVLNRDAACHF
jgi:hypothetical protein